MNHYYASVEQYLIEHSEIEFKPKLINFEGLEDRALSTLCNNLYAHRKSLNFSQPKMAKILGISLSQYKKYEYGAEILSVEIAQKWALRMGATFFHLLEGSAYDQGFAIGGYDKKLSFIWFIANSLNDKYFLKLIHILCLFNQKQHLVDKFQPSGVTREEVNKAIHEVENENFIAIAYGLQAIRKHFGCSQEQMAELMGVAISTYQQYESPTIKPKFNVFTAARYGMATGINPLVILQGTQYAKVRFMQETRMALIREIVDEIDIARFIELKPLIDGFSLTANATADAVIVDV